MGRVWVTGGAGFIGHHVVLELLRRGYEPVVVDDLSTGSRDNLIPGVAFRQLDITDKEVMALLAEDRPDAVIHLAAQVDVGRSIREPLRDGAINVMGLLHMLEGCRAARTPKVVMASSAAVYGAPVKLPLDEGQPLTPLSPYGLTKAAGEGYLRIYGELFGMQGVALRFSNVYGPRQDASGEGGVVAIFIDGMLKGKTPVIFGTGGQTRDFIFVEDVARAVVDGMESQSSGVYNISTSSRTSVLALFEKLREITGFPSGPAFGPSREGDIDHSYLDNRKAKASLGWEPKVSLEEGLRRTVQAWKERHYGG